jgi:hypothetical protein
MEKQLKFYFVPAPVKMAVILHLWYCSGHKTQILKVFKQTVNGNEETVKKNVEIL